MPGPYAACWFNRGDSFISLLALVETGTGLGSYFFPSAMLLISRTKNVDRIPYKFIMLFLYKKVSARAQKEHVYNEIYNYIKLSLSVLCFFYCFASGTGEWHFFKETTFHFLSVFLHFWQLSVSLWKYHEGRSANLTSYSLCSSISIENACLTL